MFGKKKQIEEAELLVRCQEIVKQMTKTITGSVKGNKIGSLKLEKIENGTLPIGSYRGEVWLLKQYMSDIGIDHYSNEKGPGWKTVDWLSPNIEGHKRSMKEILRRLVVLQTGLNLNYSAKKK